MGVVVALDLLYAVTQRQPPLFESTQKQLVERRRLGETVDRGVEVGMLDAQVDQLTGGGVEIGIQRVFIARQRAKGPQATTRVDLIIRRPRPKAPRRIA